MRSTWWGYVRSLSPLRVAREASAPLSSSVQASGCLAPDLALGDRVLVLLEGTAATVLGRHDPGPVTLSGAGVTAAAVAGFAALTVTFSRPFARAPVVVVTAGHSHFFASVEDVTAASFRAMFRQPAGTLTIPVPFFWIATVGGS